MLSLPKTIRIVIVLSRRTSRRRKQRHRRHSHLVGTIWLAIDQVEQHIRVLTHDLKVKKEEFGDRREQQLRMKTQNEVLEQIITDEAELRERGEFEQKRVLAIPLQTPSYWGPNAFTESCREIQLSCESSEFKLINNLLNSTISTHGDRYETINGRNPTEFIVTEIQRLQNKRLWHEYCCKKDSIIQKSHHRLSKAGCSNHLESHLLLTPLLDRKSNEYWLFHWCSHETLPHLLRDGYDPRVSSLKGMFGGVGFYLAENPSKSNQYIPCLGCKDNAITMRAGYTCSNQAEFVFSMIVYRVILNDTHVALQYNKDKYCNDTDKGSRVRRPPMKTNCDELYDSVMGESIAHGGDQLLHREFVLYERGQAYPEYIIRFRRSAQNASPSTDMNRLLQRCHRFLINTFRLVPE